VTNGVGAYPQRKIIPDLQKNNKKMQILTLLYRLESAFLLNLHPDFTLYIHIDKEINFL